MKSKISKSILVIVAHPDDEILWAGGTILSHPTNKWFIVCLCRASDTDRSPKFYKTLKLLNAEGIMGDLDDGPTQEPLDEKELEDYILQLVPTTHFDLIITHSSKGEYTRHLRHEEVNKAAISLWHNGQLTADELWTFAYEDGNKAYFPRAIEKANFYETLPEEIWKKKYSIITETYGYSKDSWEAETTPLAEAFWQFKDSDFAKKSILKTDKELNIFKTPSIEVLKSLYYNSIGSVFTKKSWDLEIHNLKDTFLQYDNIQYAKESFVRLGRELKIFKNPNIDVLKLLYKKSIGYVFNKDSRVFETPYVSKVLRNINKKHIAKKTLDKIGHELRIFNHPTIENLKLLYFKTNKFFEGTQQQNEQISSI